MWIVIDLSSSSDLIFLSVGSFLVLFTEIYDTQNYILASCGVHDEI